MNQASHQSDPHQRARLRWRARRGLLENDLILTRFLDRHETELADDEVGALTTLLDLSDNDLMDLILARKPLTTEQQDQTALKRMIEMLRSV